MAQVIPYEQFLASNGSLDAFDPRWPGEQTFGGPWHCTESNMLSCMYFVEKIEFLLTFYLS